MDSLRVGLVLASGAANGDWQAGVLYALGGALKVDKIAASSVGCYNAIMVSQRQTEKLKELWLDKKLKKKVLKGSGLFGVIGCLFGRDGIYSNKGLVKLFVDNITSDLKKDISFEMLNTQTGENQKCLASGIKYDVNELAASAIMQGVWKSMDGFIDGGNYNPIPYNLLDDCDKIIVIENYPNTYETWENKGLIRGIKMFMRGIRLGQYEVRRKQIEAIKDNPKYLIIQPDKPTGDFLDFSTKSRKQGFALGEIAGNKIKNKVNAFIS